MNLNIVSMVTAMVMGSRPILSLTGHGDSDVTCWAEKSPVVMQLFILRVITGRNEVGPR